MPQRFRRDDGALIVWRNPVMTLVWLTARATPCTVAAILIRLTKSPHV
ncbi:MAG TPA: hypothetical protein VE111_13770 [Bradyrhizobium sp.]|nr:hypothetical protein [Bradyrhizobium sp.]